MILFLIGFVAGSFLTSAIFFFVVKRYIDKLIIESIERAMEPPPLRGLPATPPLGRLKQKDIHIRS